MPNSLLLGLKSHVSYLQVDFKAGSVVFKKGDPGNEFYIVREVSPGCACKQSWR